MLSRLRNRLNAAREARSGRRATVAAGERARALPRGADVDEIMDFLLAEPPGGIETWQIAEEFRALARLVSQRRPRTLLEIGTADGGTLFAHARLATSMRSS